MFLRTLCFLFYANSMLIMKSRCTITFRNIYDFKNEIVCSQFSLSFKFDDVQVLKATSLFKIVAFKNFFMKRVIIILCV